MLNNLNSEKFGKCICYERYTIFDDKLFSIDYSDYTGFTMDLLLLKDKLYGKINNKEVTDLSIKYKSSFDKKYDNNPIIVHNYNNSKNKTDTLFILTKNINNIDIDLSFDKENAVAELKNIFTVYKYYSNSDYINYNKKIEDIVFIDNGYYHHDYENMKEDIWVNGEIYNYNLFLKKENKIGLYLFDNLPTQVINRDNVYDIKYDKYGLVEKIKKDSNTISYTNFIRDKEAEFKYSVYPLLYNPFDQSLLGLKKNDSTSLWVSCIMAKYQKNINIMRYIYRGNNIEEV